jgi:asparagine synthetase B (glutamine-hydrolysing)
LQYHTIALCVCVFFFNLHLLTFFFEFVHYGMCGICLLIRQRVATTARARERDATTQPAAPHSTNSGGTSTLPVNAREDAHLSALVPSSPDAYALLPCTCTLAGLDVRSFLSGADADNHLFRELIHNLRRRGPDTFGVTRRSFVTSCRAPIDRYLSCLLRRTRAEGETKGGEEEDGVVTLRTEVAGVASVLGLRGHSTVAQPYDMNVAADADDDRQANSWDYRSSLMWNGEIFGGSLCPPPWGSDTVLLATRLSQMELECVRLTTSTAAVNPDERHHHSHAHGNNDDADEEGEMAALLPLVERQRIFLRRCTTLFEQHVEGPYSFIFLATRLRLAVFGRDPLGRHSLLSHVRVTQPVVAAEELDIELIISSVGVQHHHPHENGRKEQCGGGKGGTGEYQSMRLPTPSSSSSPPLPRDKKASDVAPLASPAAKPWQDGAAVPFSFSSAPSTVPVEGESCCSVPRSSADVSTAAKRPRHERQGAARLPRGGATHGAGAADVTVAATAEDGEDGEDSGGVGTAGQHDVCWQEVGVTGLFAVPLQTPLIYRNTNWGHGSTVSSTGGEVSGTCTSAGDRLHPVCLSAAYGSAADGSGAAASLVVSGAHVLLLHCPWQRTYHLVHPLLRTATLPMMPHEPPSFELILAHEEIAVLPEPLLRWASHLMKSMQPDGGLDQSWVDWAAAHYMLALAVSMHRRITVANSGAADGRDVQELSTARRRPLCILFSGGIDCTVIAALAHYILPAETPIELVNVAFGDNPEEAPDRVAAFRSMAELLRLPLLSTSRSADADVAVTPEREWRLVLVDVPSKTTTDSAHIKDLLVPRHTVMDLDIGTALWYAARASGRMQILRRSDLEGGASIDDDSFDGTPPITTIGSPTASAAAASSLRTGAKSANPTVTLEGFSKHFRAYTGSTTAVSGISDSPDGVVSGGPCADRLSPCAVASSSFPYASSVVPVGVVTAVAPATTTTSSEEVANAQKYQILVDVLVKEGRGGGGPMTPVLLSTLGKEYSLFLQPHIKRYGYKKLGSFLNDAAKAGYIKFAPDAPSKAVRLCRPADMERATAVPPSPWFTTAHMAAHEPNLSASRDLQPLLPCPGTFHQTYTSHAKVVLLGMGADETLGGYTRYRRFFQREGMTGAQRELERDFARLWQRNLGRDDRVTMDSGREPRFPFLDEGVLRTLEWIVLKRRNNILVTHAHLLDGSSTVVMPASPTVSTAAANGSGGACRSTGLLDGGGASTAAPLTHDELLHRSLEPIVSFQLPPGEGDKRVLRRVASVLGLRDVAHLQKRAIQFGSRIAERKVKGTTDF